MTEVTIVCMDIYVQNKQAHIELVWDVMRLHSLTREGRGPERVGTLRSANGDVHEKVAEKQTSHHFKLFHDYPNSPCYFKRGGFWLKLKRGERAQVRTEMVDFIALPFPFPSKLKIWSFHVLVVQWRQRNVQKSVMHVQSCYFAH